MPLSLSGEEVTFTWHRKAFDDETSSPIMECDANGVQDPAGEMACTAATYTLTDDDVAKAITLVASYTTRNCGYGRSGMPIQLIVGVEAGERHRSTSENIGRVYSPNLGNWYAKT